MTKLAIKIGKNYKTEANKKEKWLTVDLEEAVQYGSSSYSKIKIEFNSEKEIEDFQAGVKLNLVVPDDKTKGEGDILVIPEPWEANRTIPQKVTDTAAKVGGKVKAASIKATQATGKGVEETGKKIKDLPAWVLPVVIVGGFLLLGGILYWIFKKK